MTDKTSSVVAFFVDADNLSANSVEEAFEHFHRLGSSVIVRRAYGGIEKLSGMKAVLRRFAMQAFVNQGKGTTDVALVVDAMDFLHRSAMPTTVAIGSSDADFAPLAVRLREAGMRVVCFAQRDKAAEALPLCYDEVVYVDSASPPAQLKPAGATPHRSVDRVPLVAEPVAQPAVRALSSPPVPTGMVITSVKAPEDPATVRRILAEIPGWLPNTIRQLNQLGKLMRESGIKKGSKPLHELFSKHPAYFKVLPINGPAKQVRLLKSP
jgi:hypothetical protein